MDTLCDPPGLEAMVKKEKSLWGQRVPVYWEPVYWGPVKMKGDPDDVCGGTHLQSQHWGRLQQDD